MFSLSDVAKATLKQKARLYIEYALIGLLLVTAGFGAYNYVTRLKLDNKVTTLQGKVETADARVALVEDVNRQQAETLETIRGLNGVNDTMLKGLAADMEALRVRDRTTYTRLAALEKSNEAVRKYLNTAVPAPVGCVLDRSCPDPDAGGVPATNGRPAGAVRAAQPGGKPH